MGSYQGKRVGAESAKLKAFMDRIRAEIGMSPLYYNFEPTTELARFASFGGAARWLPKPKRAPGDGR